MNKNNINEQLINIYKNEYEVITKMCMPNGSIMQVFLNTTLTASILTQILLNNESYQCKFAQQRITLNKND